MSAESQLYAALHGHPGLASIIGDRIWPDAIPEGKPLPSIVYVRASTLPTYTIGGVLVCEDVHFSISAWAESRAVANAVAAQLSAALSAAGNPPLDQATGFDEERGLFAVTIETDWFWSV